MHSWSIFLRCYASALASSWASMNACKFWNMEQLLLCLEIEIFSSLKNVQKYKEESKKSSMQFYFRHLRPFEGSGSDNWPNHNNSLFMTPNRDACDATKKALKKYKSRKRRIKVKWSVKTETQQQVIYCVRCENFHRLSRIR